MQNPLLRLKDSFLKDKCCLGLDIGTSCVKAVRMKTFKENTELDAFYIEPAQPDLATALKKVSELSAMKSVNTSVSGTQAVIRYVNFPEMNKEELSKALKFEAQKHIPFPVSETNLDNCILKQGLSGNKMLVLLAAVKKEIINQRIKLIEECGLKINMMDIDSIALINAFNFNCCQDATKNKTIALLNIGASMSNLDILEDGFPALSRDIYIAGNNFTQKIADIQGTDFNSAEKIKISKDKEKSEKIAVAMEPVFSELARELRTSFDYYESQSASSVLKIFLSGAGSFSAGINGILANQLGIEVEYWDPLRKVNISNSIDQIKIKAVSSQLAIAVGLALRY